MLLAFATSNDLARLEAGKESVILGTRRVFTEETNSYKIKHLPSGVEIEAITPGLEIGAGGLISVPRFERGFTRWTHKANMSNPAGTSSQKQLSFEYNRFTPKEGKLVQERRVAGGLRLLSDSQIVTEFRPAITEKSLTVLDYSSRLELLPLTKGVIDYNYRYGLTNRSWKYDKNLRACLKIGVCRIDVRNPLGRVKLAMKKSA